jgi:haloalkane dehalogenase
MSDTQQIASVRGTTMAYLQEGAGRPIVLLHGNPTSSYLWRNVIPRLRGHGRVIAPDLVGHGDSAKLPGTGDARYSLAEHQAYVDALLNELDVREDVVLVGHDWGGPLVFDWARRHPDAVTGIAYLETIVMPFTWDGFGEIAELFRAWRSPAGEELVLQGNQFVEGLVPNAIMRTLDDDEWAEYRRPWTTAGEDRRPTLTWPRQIPIDGEPADVHATIEAIAQFLSGTTIPKLFINVEPGLAMTDRERSFARTLPNQTEVTVKGLHFAQEDSPDEIGDAIAEFVDRLSATRRTPMRS